MHELVHTSLPNGLIPGSHGFATAAMTRNLPDVLRTRLELLSAYSHRASAHDASYDRENPVNWQHLILPRGEHVVSRIAAAPFDYTGRTNRLARHVCFARGELPVNGAVRAIGLAARHLNEPWTGEARWLETDGVLESACRADVPDAVQTTAPNWDNLLGRGVGTETARRVAQFVKDNIRSPQKSISFRVSAEQDADGSRLLALFSDVIALLPVELRPLVTFSTYAATLPTGMSCLLRGVYDETPAFKVTSAVQFWVDCIHSRAVNAELLPRIQAPASAVPADALKAAPRPAVVLCEAPVARVRSGGTSVSRAHAPEGWGARWIVFGGLAVLLVVLAGGAGLWAWDQSQRDRVAEATAQAKQAEMEQARRAAAEEQARRTKEAEDLRRAAEKRADDVARKEEAERKKKLQGTAERRDQELEDSLKKLKDARKVQEKPAPHVVVDAAHAFTNFTGAVVWRRPDPARDRNLVAQTNAWVYYMHGEKLEWRPFTLLEKVNRLDRHATPERVLSPSPREAFWGDSPFVIWYDDGRLFWQWNAVKGIRFQSTNDVVDVVAKLTGGDARVRSVFVRGGGLAVNEVGLKDAASEEGRTHVLPLGDGRMTFPTVFQAQCGGEQRAQVKADIDAKKQEIAALRTPRDVSAELEEARGKLRKVEADLQNKTVEFGTKDPGEIQAKEKKLRREKRELKNLVAKLGEEQRNVKRAEQEREKKIKRLEGEIEDLKLKLLSEKDVLDKTFVLTVSPRGK